MIRHTAVFDVECYRNYFLIAFRNIATGSVKFFELFGEDARFTPAECNMIKGLMKSLTLISFNGNHYDLPMISLALSGATCSTLKDGSDSIIVGGLQFWVFEKKYNIVIPRDLDHIDIFRVAPGVSTSLKIYGGRVHAPRMQDLPIKPDDLIREDQRVLMRDYNLNDLQVTSMLHGKLTEQIALRAAMTAEYGIDLRSKSDAQIGEALIVELVNRKTGMKVPKPESRAGDRFKYNIPDWLSYNSRQMNDVLTIIRDTWFMVDMKDQVLMPDALYNANISIGNSIYRMGIGGLHSSEESISHYAVDGYQLRDLDVTSYYPTIIINQGLYPGNVGMEFCDVYKGIVERRVAAKREGNKVVADSLKIAINGSFGKFGNRWSKLYSPELMIQVTMTGQLALLMLIDMLETNGISVISGNTDGIVVKVHETQLDTLEAVKEAWQAISRFNLEESKYRSLHSRDVNSYAAVKEDGTVKTKGLLAAEGLQKNPYTMVVTDAVIEYLTHGIMVEDTINACQDVRRFVSVQTVKGGAIDHHGHYLGKAVRWYYAKYTPGSDFMGDPCLYYLTNMNRVSDSLGARPLMELPQDGLVPADVDRDWYIREARKTLRLIGVNA